MNESVDIATVWTLDSNVSMKIVKTASQRPVVTIERARFNVIFIT